MTKQVRDWQEDMKLVEAYKHAQTLHNTPYPSKLAWQDNLPEPTILILEYWLKQYAAEKERADKLEQERDDAISGLTESYKELSWNYDRMKLRERELKETMKWAIEQSRWGDPLNALKKAITKLQSTLASLYPEEETK